LIVRIQALNAFTEGVNNTIKVIKRIGYGYRNDQYFRAHILATVNDKAG
jgi:transposase